MSPTLVAVMLGSVSILGGFAFAGWLVWRHERRVDAQLAAELAKVNELARALIDAQGVEVPLEDLRPDVVVDPTKPDLNILDSIVLRSKKKPPN